MKTAPLLFLSLLLSLTACSTNGHGKSGAAKSDPETVVVTYHVKPGKEAELEDVLARIWNIYQREHLVFAEPHVIVREKEDGDKTRYIEILTWVSHSAPVHAPDSVKTIWNEEQSICEPRDGHTGIGGGEVDLLVPKEK